MASREFDAGELSKTLVVLPNWVGDVVLATPALRAIRHGLTGSEITYLMRPYVSDILQDSPWVDRVEFWPESRSRRRSGLLALSRRLREHGYTAVLLFTNSFRTACLAWLVRAERRIGYARDYRSFLLTDRLEPLRQNGQFTIESMLSYYSRLANYVGCSNSDGPLELHTDAQSDEEVARWWTEFGIEDGQPVVVLNPGAAFGGSKLYPPVQFGAVATALAEQFGAKILVTGGPKESAIVEKVRAASKTDAVALTPPRLNLRRLKSVIARSSLLVTNDTGPRHFAIAFDVPVVTIFGPTHPEWTETNYRNERKVLIPVDCGPCQKPICPLDHRCMTGISPEMVVEQASHLLKAGAK
jgi:heptosyltransferase-2